MLALLAWFGGVFVTSTMGAGEDEAESAKGLEPEGAPLRWLLSTGCVGGLGSLGSALAVILGMVCLGPSFCSDDSEVILNWGPELAPADALPASSIASNNLAPDGGGMSPNGQDLAALELVPNCTPARSDQPAALASSVLVVFRTTSANTAEGGLRLSHFGGVSFTPPTRLRAPDMDPSQPIRILGR